jgi:hypothetical protein
MIDPAEQSLQPSLARIAALVAALEELPDAGAREQARALVQAVLEIHRVGLSHLVAHLIAEADRERASAEPGWLDALERDDAVSLLLSLHGLHPRDLDTRVRAALAPLRPALLAAGIAIELRAVDGEVVRVALRPAGGAAPHADPHHLRAAVEAAIRRGAPEIAAVEIDGLEAGPIVPASRLAATKRT